MTSTQNPSCHCSAVGILAGTCEGAKHPLSVWLDSAPAYLLSEVRVKKKYEKETSLVYR